MVLEIICMLSALIIFIALYRVGIIGELLALLFVIATIIIGIVLIVPLVVGTLAFVAIFAVVFLVFVSLALLLTPKKHKKIKSFTSKDGRKKVKTTTVRIEY
jgi:hypothetical protein